MIGGSRALKRSLVQANVAERRKSFAKRAKSTVGSDKNIIAHLQKTVVPVLGIADAKRASRQVHSFQLSMLLATQRACLRFEYLLFVKNA